MLPISTDSVNPKAVRVILRSPRRCRGSQANSVTPGTGLSRKRNVTLGPLPALCNSGSLELPQHLAVGRVVGLEPAVGFAGEQESASRGETAADHRLRRLDLPGDLPVVVVDRGAAIGSSSQAP